MTSRLRNKHARMLGNIIHHGACYLDLKIKSMPIIKFDRELATSDLLVAHISEFLARGSRVDVVCNNVINKFIFLVLSCYR